VNAAVHKTYKLLEVPVGQGVRSPQHLVRVTGLLYLVPAGFGSVHPYASLTEVVSYYWDALTRLGFEGRAEAVSAETTVYTFENGGAQVKVVFAQQEDAVTASVSWTQAEVAGL